MIKAIDERRVLNGSIIVIDTKKGIKCIFLNSQQLKQYNRNKEEDLNKIIKLKNTIKF